MSRRNNIYYNSLYKYPSLRVIFGFIIMLFYELHFLQTHAWYERRASTTFLIYGTAIFIIFTASFYSAGRIYNGVQNIQFRLTFLVLILCTFLFLDAKRFLLIENRNPTVLELRKHTTVGSWEDYRIYFREDYTCRIEIISDRELGQNMLFYEANFRIVDDGTIRIYTSNIDITHRRLPSGLAIDGDVYKIISYHDFEKDDYLHLEYFTVLKKDADFLTNFEFKINLK